jgi:hypothetical protein
MANLAPAHKATSSSPWIWVVLIITLALTAWMATNGDNNTTNDVELAKTDNASQPRVSHRQRNTVKLLNNDSKIESINLIPWQALKREANSQNIKDLFKSHSWVVAAPAPKFKPAPPPPPTAPPAPFAYIGKLENGENGTQVFLSENNKIYAVAEGENINQLWRLDSEDSNHIQMTFLPLNLPQVLSKNRRMAPIVRQVPIRDMNQ